MHKTGSRSLGIVRKPMIIRLLAVAVVGSTVVAVLSSGAFGRESTASPSATKGEVVFKSAGCAGCHTFKAVSATGKIGPNLDKVKLTVTQIVTEVTKGGSAVMTKADAAKYKGVMPAFKGRLTQVQIADLAAFVYRDRNKAAVCKVVSSSGCVTGANGGTGSAQSGTGTGAAGTGGSNDVGCAPGVTVVTAGNTDADDDDTGGHDDGDGCV